jgi:peptidoglycan/LPS O-acetylase OafA/YrhL
MKQPKHRLEWLDSLRGIAALLVTIIHLFGTLRYNYPNAVLFKKGSPLGVAIFDFFDAGRVGVVLFFFVSGFVIPYSILNKGLKHFTISRLFRLYPAYWISIILAVLVNGLVSAKILLVNITMFQKFIGVEDIIGVYWTLQIEIVFYIFCAILYKRKVLYDDKILKYTFYAMLSLSLLFAIGRYVTEKKIPVALPLSMCIMFLGLIFRKFILKEGTVTKKQIFVMFTSFLILLLPICLLAYDKDFGFDERWYKYFSSYFIAIIFFLIYSRYKFASKLFAFIGTISYSLYLIHVLVFNAMDSIKIYKTISPLNYTLIFYIIAFGIATLCYYFIEKPAVNYGRKLLKK